VQNIYFKWIETIWYKWVLDNQSAILMFCLGFLLAWILGRKLLYKRLNKEIRRLRTRLRRAETLLSQEITDSSSEREKSQVKMLQGGKHSADQRTLHNQKS